MKYEFIGVPRTPQIDALRGFALLGILIVNIQSMVWGMSGYTLGPLGSDSSPLDAAIVFITAFLFEYKFYPLFCFCFGYGFAVQARRWRIQGLPLRQRYTRRLAFMLGLGLLHGSLIWFGDILTRYAFSACFLYPYLGKGPRTLLKGLKIWAGLTLVLTLFLAVSNSLLAVDSDPVSLAAAKTAYAQQAQDILQIYTQGDYIPIAAQRISDYLEITAGALLYFPELVMLFLAGALTAQMGWLRQPERHRAAWGRVLRASLAIGIPLNFLYANQSLAIARGEMPDWGILGALLPQSGMILSLAYVAALALIAPTGAGSRLIAGFAPAGKLALSNYLLQSLIVTTLLYGYGWGLGATLKQAALFQLALVVYITLLIGSHLYLRFYRQGPFEALWRRYTYAGERQ
ncbi:MAG: DUF418 domain-containing protein [Betaproteobacteria bacterium]|nr:DUF418 domain-containing protein [Betaproteobacteria bacterium]